MKSGNLNFLEPSGPLQACNGTALPLPLLGTYGESNNSSPIAFAAQCMAWVCRRSLAGTVASNHTWGREYLSLAIVVYRQVEESATG